MKRILQMKMNVYQKVIKDYQCRIRQIEVKVDSRWTICTLGKRMPKILLKNSKIQIQESWMQAWKMNTSTFTKKNNRNKAKNHQCNQLLHYLEIRMHNLLFKIQQRSKFKMMHLLLHQVILQVVKAYQV